MIFVKNTVVHLRNTSKDHRTCCGIELAKLENTICITENDAMDHTHREFPYQMCIDCDMEFYGSMMQAMVLRDLYKRISADI
jgi:hypothetical protein